MDKPILFHSIGLESHESAAVRAFIVEQGLIEQIEFANIHYEGPRERLVGLLGVAEAPALLTKDGLIQGRQNIVDWLKLAYLPAARGQ
jgi:hypothetical protein